MYRKLCGLSVAIEYNWCNVFLSYTPESFSIHASKSLAFAEQLGYEVNVLEFKPRPLCKKDCNSMVGNKHIATAQRGSRKTLYQYNTLSQLHSIPPELIHDIFSYMV